MKADSIAGLEYKGQPIQEVIIESAIKQDQILVQLTRMERRQADLENKKADKTEFTSFETRLTNIETNQDKDRDLNNERYRELDHKIVLLDNSHISEEKLEKSTESIKEHMVSMFTPLKEQVKTNTENISDLTKNVIKWTSLITGAVGTINFFIFIYGDKIKDIFN